MADIVEILPPEYGFVLITFFLSFILLNYLSFQVFFARKRYGVEYPNMYAIEGITKIKTDTEYNSLINNNDCTMFNCIQRAHQNTLEIYPLFLASLLLGGLLHPIICSVGGIIWMLGRLFYAHGYYTGMPSNRTRGSFGYIGYYTMIIVVMMLAVKLIIKFVHQKYKN